MIAPLIFRLCTACVLFVSLYLFTTVSANYPSEGVDQEYCRTPDQCADGRSCYVDITSGSPRNCTDDEENCRCSFAQITKCNTSMDCSFGERCYIVDGDVPEERALRCATCKLGSFENLQVVDSNPSTCDGVWLGGYTGDICFVNYKDCAPGRTCKEFLEDGSADKCSFTTEPCYCWPENLLACSSSNECESGERCARNADGVQSCFSCGRVEADDSITAVDSDAVCTAATPLPSPGTNDENTPSTEPEVYPSGGVSLEYCRVKENCAGSRNCFTSVEGVLESCNETSTKCFCRYSDRQECSSSDDCSTGERCYGWTNTEGEFEGQFCWTCRMQLTEQDSLVDSDPATCKDVWLGGYTGDICAEVYSDCASGRRCSEFLEDGTTDFCSLGTNPCYCWPRSLTTCTSSSECVPGERCATNANGETACFSCGRVESDSTFTAVDTSAVCTTPTSTPSPITSVTVSPDSSSVITDTPSPSPTATSADNPSPSRNPAASIQPAITPPCIAVTHLEDFTMKDLVYGEHQRASVLCDASGSCATPGHVVVYHGMTMMMASYCGKYSVCSKRASFVNNPRMRRARRIPSNTDGLQFTVFSARYESVLEEALMRLLTFAGL